MLNLKSSHGGHLEFPIGKRFTILVQDHPMIIPAKSQFYQICVFGADLKSKMAARVHNVFSLAEILKIFLSETTKSIEL
jgi:hypothetical protein